MGEQQHTPGPWRVEFGKHYPRAIARENHTDEPGGINSIVRWNGIGFPSSPEARANALLIAAAPDMLAALRGVLEAVPRSQDRPPMMSIGQWHAVEAAIARATGTE